jgi:hypothetical protein
MQISSRNPMMFISLMVAAGATVLVEGALNMHPVHQFLFLPGIRFLLVSE